MAARRLLDGDVEVVVGTTGKLVFTGVMLSEVAMTGAGTTACGPRCSSTSPASST